MFPGVWAIEWKYNSFLEILFDGTHQALQRPSQIYIVPHSSINLMWTIIRKVTANMQLNELPLMYQNWDSVWQWYSSTFAEGRLFAVQSTIHSICYLYCVFLECPSTPRGNMDNCRWCVCHVSFCSHSPLQFQLQLLICSFIGSYYKSDEGICS